MSQAVRIVLASASPRRREILTQLGLSFEVIVSDIDESELPSESPANYVMRLSEQKARAVANTLRHHDDTFVLGADTTVVLDGRVLGKPTDLEDSKRMLRALRGRVHTVMTGICVWSNASVEQRLVSTEVRFRNVSDDTVARYAASGEGLDKAGSYAIQGLGAGLVAEIQGSYTNVVGLPAAETLELLESAGAVASWP